MVCRNRGAVTGCHKHNAHGELIDARKRGGQKRKTRRPLLHRILARASLALLLGVTGLPDGHGPCGVHPTPPLQSRLFPMSAQVNQDPKVAYY